MEYQDCGFDTRGHNILSYETLMAYPYNLLHLTQLVKIGSHWYIYCFGTTRAHIEQESEYIPWGNTVTLTKREAIFSINGIMANYM